MPGFSDPAIKNIFDAYQSEYPSAATIILIQQSMRTSDKIGLMDRVVCYPGMLERTRELLKSSNPNDVMMADAFLRVIVPHGNAAALIAVHPGILQDLWDAHLRVPPDYNQNFRRRELKAMLDILTEAAAPNLIIQVQPRLIALEPKTDDNVVRLYHRIAGDTTHGDVHQLYPVFKDACNQLSFIGNHKNTFDTAVRAYALPTRGYHDEYHAYKMAHWTDEDMRALCVDLDLSPQEAKNVHSFLTVGGLFHDPAYAQVDQGLEPEIEGVVNRYGHFDKGVEGKGPYSFKIHGHLADTSAGKLVCDVFGFVPGQTIYAMGDPKTGKVGGLNEFLSALTVADRLLNGEAPTNEKRNHTATIAAIIEGTIPFRSAAAFEDLNARLMKIGLSPRDAKIAVKSAVLLANRDVEDFCGGQWDAALSGEARLKQLVGGTWRLMPENNWRLRGQHYTPDEYLTTLSRTRGFIGSLTPTAIFHHFRGFPDTAEMEKRYALAEHNLKLFDGYVTSKIASASIIAAVAKKIDPQGTASLYEIMNGITCQTFSPAPTNDHLSGDDLILLNTLWNRGDKPPFGWDIQGSPIGAFLVQSLGVHETHNIAAAAADHLKANNPRPEDFLAYLNSTYPLVTKRIFEALENVASTTADQAIGLGRTATMRLGRLREILAS